MASNGNQNDSKNTHQLNQDQEQAQRSPRPGDRPKSLDDIIASLTSNDSGSPQSPRPPRPQIPRTETELDSRPPLPSDPVSDLDSPLNLKDDPFSGGFDEDGELQFDFDQDLLSSLDDPMSMAPQAQAPEDPSSEMSWLDEEPISNIEGMFATSLGTPISVEPAPAFPEDSSEEHHSKPSLTPSGRPMSLQPHEELSFQFGEEREASEEIKLDRLNLGSIIEDEFEPDADESVDRIIEGNRKRWSKPPEAQVGQSQGSESLKEEAQRLLSQSERPTILPPVDFEERVPEFSTFPPAAPPPEFEDNKLDNNPDSIDDEIPIFLPEEVGSAHEDGFSFGDEFVTPDAFQEQMQAAASGLPGAEVIHIPTDAPTSAPPVKDDELDALAEEDQEINPDIDESAELFQALETELSLLSDPPLEAEPVVEDELAFDDEDGSQEDLPTMDLPEHESDSSDVDNEPLSLPNGLFDDEAAFDQKLAEIDEANQTQHLSGEMDSEDLIDDQDSIDDLMKDLGIEEAAESPVQNAEAVFAETQFMHGVSDEELAQEEERSDHSILDTPLPFEPELPKEELEDLSEILELDAAVEPAAGMDENGVEVTEPEAALDEPIEESIEENAAAVEPEVALEELIEEPIEESIEENAAAVEPEVALEELIEEPIEESIEENAAAVEPEVALEELIEEPIEESIEENAEAVEPEIALEEPIEEPIEESIEENAEAVEPEVALEESAEEFIEENTEAVEPEEAQEASIEEHSETNHEAVAEATEIKQETEEIHKNLESEDILEEPKLEELVPQFIYQPNKLQDAALRSNWFAEHPLPTYSDCEQMSEEEYDIFEMLYQSAQKAAIQSEAITHLLDLSALAHERAKQFDFAMDCAVFALEYEPQSALAESKVQRLLDRVDHERSEQARVFLSSRDVVYQHHVGHLLYGEGRPEEAFEIWQQEAIKGHEKSSGLELALALYLSDLARGDQTQALKHLDRLLMTIEDRSLHALFLGERLRLIHAQGDKNALRSAIFRGIKESGKNATPSLIAQLEREALQSQDYDLLIESLRLRLGLEEVSASAIRERKFKHRSKDVGYLAYKLGWLLERRASGQANEQAQNEAAFEAYLVANYCLANERFVLMRIVSLARKLEAYSHVRRALKQLAARSNDHNESASLWYQSGLVALYLEGDSQEAKIALNRAIELSPTFTPALAKLGELALEAGDMSSLRRCFSDEIESLERQLQELESDAAYTEAKANLRSYLKHTLIRRCYQYGRLLDELGENDSALNYHLMALSFDPNFSPSLIAVEELYEQRRRWRRLVTMYERRLELMTNAKVEDSVVETSAVDDLEEGIEQTHEQTQQDKLSSISALRLAIADISSAYLDDTLKANRLYAQVATFDAPSHLYALRRASETYEALGEYSSAFIIEQRRAKLYKLATGHDQGLLFNAAALQEHIGEQNGEDQQARNGVLTGEIQALSSYQQLWQNTHSPAAFDGLWRCIIRSGQIEGLNYYLAPRSLCHIGSETLVFQAVETLMCSGQLDRAVELLSIWQEYLDEFGSVSTSTTTEEVTTLQTWLRSVTLGISDEAQEDRGFEFTWEDYQQQERAEKLIERLVHDGDWMGAIQALIRLAQLATPSEQAAIWHRVGFYTEIGINDQKAAYAYYRKALRLNPHNKMALVALRRHDLKQGDWNAYLQCSTTLAELETSITTQEAIYTHLGHLNVRVLDEEMVALDYYQKALDLALICYDQNQGSATENEGDQRELALPAALKARYEILCRREEWSELTTELECFLPELNAVAQAVVLDWLSWIHETKTAQQDLAIKYSLALMDIDPSNTRVRRASRAQLAQSAAEQLTQSSSLRELGQETADLDHYLAFLKEELERDDSDLDQLSAYTRIAQVYERQGELKYAERYWKRAFRLDPEFLPASQGLGRAAYRRQSWRELVSLYRKELNVFEPNSPQRVELLRRLAELYEHRLQRPSSASRCYEDILSILPDDSAALASLDRLYQETGEWRSLARVWNSQAHRLTEASAQGAAFLRAAEHFMEAGSEEQALNAYEHAYQANPYLHPASWAIEFIMYRRQGLGRIIELYRSMRKAISLPFEKQLLTHKLILELSPAQVQRALHEELYDERDDLEVIWWQIHTAIEQGDSVAQSEGLFELAQRVEDERDAYSLVLEAVQRLCQGRHLDRRYRDYWDRVQLTNPQSRMAWWAMTEQAFRYEREPQEYRSMLARLSRVGDETRQRAQAIWLQALHEFDHSGKYRVVTELIEEAIALDQETITPSLLRQLLSPIKGRVATLESLNELSHRLPEGDLRGDALFKLALLEAEDAPELAMEHALQATRNHIPQAISLAEALYKHIEQGQDLDLTQLDPQLLRDLLGIEIAEEIEEETELEQLEQLEAVVSVNPPLHADDDSELALSFDDEASHIEFDFEDDDFEDDDSEESESETSELQANGPEADHDASAESQEHELEIAITNELAQDEGGDHAGNSEDSDEKAGSMELGDSDFVPEGDEA